MISPPATTLDCAAAKNLLGLRPSDLSSAEHLAREAHLAGCPSCRGEMEREKEALDLFLSLPRLRSSLTAQAVWDRDGEGEEEEEGRPPPVSSEGAWGGAFRRGGAPLAGLVVAAAALALVVIFPGNEATSPGLPRGEEFEIATESSSESNRPLPISPSGPGEPSSPSPKLSSPSKPLAAPPGDPFRWKGQGSPETTSVHIAASVERRRGGEVRMEPLGEESSLGPEDALALRFAVEGTGWLLVMEVSPSGTVTAVLPGEGRARQVTSSQVFLEDGEGRPLLWKADGGPGRYRYLALLGSKPFDKSAIDSTRILLTREGDLLPGDIRVADELTVLQLQEGEGNGPLQ